LPGGARRARRPRRRGAERRQGARRAPEDRPLSAEPRRRRPRQAHVGAARAGLSRERGCAPGARLAEELTRLRATRALGTYPRIHNCPQDRKSTRLNSSHVAISYAVFCLKKKI